MFGGDIVYTGFAVGLRVNRKIVKTAADTHTLFLNGFELIKC